MRFMGISIPGSLWESKRRGENAWYVRYMQPGFSRACAPRGLAGMDAGVNYSLGFASQNPQPKNSMDAVFRQRKG
jgi:hypothetical protein